MKNKEKYLKVFKSVIEFPHFKNFPYVFCYDFLLNSILVGNHILHILHIHQTESKMADISFSLSAILVNINKLHMRMKR